MRLAELLATWLRGQGLDFQVWCHGDYWVQWVIADGMEAERDRLLILDFWPEVHRGGVHLMTIPASLIRANPLDQDTEILVNRPVEDPRIFDEMEQAIRTYLNQSEITT